MTDKCDACKECFPADDEFCVEQRRKRGISMDDDGNTPAPPDPRDAQISALKGELEEAKKRAGDAEAYARESGYTDAMRRTWDVALSCDTVATILDQYDLFDLDNGKPVCFVTGWDDKGDDSVGIPPTHGMGLTENQCGTLLEELIQRLVAETRRRKAVQGAARKLAALSKHNTDAAFFQKALADSEKDAFAAERAAHEETRRELEGYKASLAMSVEDELKRQAEPSKESLANEFDRAAAEIIDEQVADKPAEPPKVPEGVAVYHYDGSRLTDISSIWYTVSVDDNAQVTYKMHPKADDFNQDELFVPLSAYQALQARNAELERRALAAETDLTAMRERIQQALYKAESGIPYTSCTNPFCELLKAIAETLDATHPGAGLLAEVERLRESKSFLRKKFKAKRLSYLEWLRKFKEDRDRLAAANAQLRGLVEVAYRNGWSDKEFNEIHGYSETVLQDWETSDTKAKLDALMEAPDGKK